MDQIVVNVLLLLLTTFIHIFVHMYIYIYIYIYMNRLQIWCYTVECIVYIYTPFVDDS